MSGRSILERIAEDPDLAAYVEELELIANRRVAADDGNYFGEGEVRWFAVHTRAQREKAASIDLKRRGFFVFYPFQREKVRRRLPRTERRQLVEVETPLFPRYLFVALRGRPQESFAAIEAVPDVSTIVRRRFCREPLQIPGPVLDQVMQWCDDAGLVHQQEPECEFEGRPGDLLRLVDDLPYNGLVARLASIAEFDSKDRITVWLDLLGGEREVSVPASAVAEILR